MKTVAARIRTQPGTNRNDRIKRFNGKIPDQDRVDRSSREELKKQPLKKMNEKEG